MLRRPGPRGSCAAPAPDLEAAEVHASRLLPCKLLAGTPACALSGRRRRVLLSVLLLACGFVLTTLFLPALLVRFRSPAPQPLRRPNSRPHPRCDAVPTAALPQAASLEARAGGVVAQPDAARKVTLRTHRCTLWHARHTPATRRLNGTRARCSRARATPRHRRRRSARPCAPRSQTRRRLPRAPQPPSSCSRAARWWSSQRPSATQTPCAPTRARPARAARGGLRRRRRLSERPSAPRAPRRRPGRAAARRVAASCQAGGCRRGRCRSPACLSRIVALSLPQHRGPRATPL